MPLTSAPRLDASQSVATYRVALDRLRQASRALAHHIDDVSDREATEVTADDRFREIWHRYNRMLEECRAAFEDVPLQHRHRVPRPPSD